MIESDVYDDNEFHPFAIAALATAAAAAAHTITHSSTMIIICKTTHVLNKYICSL